MVSLLLQWGVNPNQTDALGKTPVAWIFDRVRHVRGAMLHRRMQFADDEERAELRDKLLQELHGMINEIHRWTEAGGVDETYVVIYVRNNCDIYPFSRGLASQLQRVALHVESKDSLELDELDSLFSSLTV